ncbi:MAG: hypothetical protein ACXV3V_13010 [Actinomycetes bacterium]
MRAIADRSAAAVEAAVAGDLEAFLPATDRLAALDAEQVGLVLGAVTRSLLEDLHPDGLSGDDVHDIIGRCARGAAAWFPGVDVTALVVVVGGALGLHPPDEEPLPVTPLDVARHAPLLVADLVSVGVRSFDPYLHAALAEIARAETVELP